LQEETAALEANIKKLEERGALAVNGKSAAGASVCVLKLIRRQCLITATKTTRA
jgi:hypothetical protein